MPCQVDWKRVVLVYVLQIYSYTAAVVVWVQLDVPRYVEYRSTVTLICNHSVSENVLHKIEFIRNEYKIFQYIKDRTPPTQMHKVPGAELQPTSAMNVIKLKDVGFEASGVYSCDVSMATPIYTVGSDSVNMEVIVPQSEDPRITFKKPYYVVGEILEANCTSSPAHPAPHITWFINGKEVDVFLVRTFPIKTRENQLMSTVAQLSIEVSALHAGENGRLEISCNSTIPTYPMQNGQYADFKSETKSIKIISVPLTPSTASSCHRENAVLLTISGIIATNGITNYLQSIVVKLLGLNLIVP
ncbi:uncharacterized protein LOC124176772 isoform X1 [Neodiprion fabricii]|uniref:uncharacterized protein LOC124176772 isoform X1 n=1 Tax=Neodiprion fabricii TaxID=2872261 RepID=UPI001ED962B3|nr:uncharacterized protein LOC124176772 isoform X1 [Neodiprion fabricii]